MRLKVALRPQVTDGGHDCAIEVADGKRTAEFVDYYETQPLDDEERYSAGRENLDAAHVARYDANEDADADNELVLLQTLGLHRHSEVVDLGAGTGQFILAAASACARGRSRCVVGDAATTAGQDQRGTSFER